MAEETEGFEGEDLEGDGSRRRLSGKKLVLFILLPILLLLGGAGAAYFLGVFRGAEEHPPAEEGEHQEAEPATKPAAPAQAIFFDLPDIIVNLNTSNRRATFLKINVSLELERSQDIDRVQQVMPRIIDNFQVYLRELRLEDLEGSAGLYRLREELLRRVNLAARPARVKDVLFKEMLVQ